MTPESMSLRPNDEFGNQLEYLLSTRNGYMNNPYEKAAYATQKSTRPLVATEATGIAHAVSKSALGMAVRSDVHAGLELRGSD